MAISITKYIDLTSSVGAGTVVPVTELSGRIFTTNDLLPTESLAQFSNATDVGAYFGTASEEYKRAVQYFSFISKNNISPENLSFARWTDADVAPMIFGSKITETLTQFQAITNGSLTLTLGGVTNVLTGLDFSAAVNLAGVAAVLQTAIRGETGLQWTAATVTYTALTPGFNFVGGSAVVANVLTAPTGSGTDLQNIIGWGALAIFSDGDVTQTLTDTLTNSAAASNNFGSFVFIPALSLDEVVEVAAWNAAQNVSFQYYVPIELSDYSTYSAALLTYAGVGIIVDPGVAGQYPDQGPMQTMAATDYASVNAVQNYMYQIYNLTPAVTDTATSNSLDAARVNYNGQTQTAGANLTFFQRGVLCGPSTAPLDMNTYANEQWMRAAITAALLNLLLNLSRIPANNNGIIQITGALLDVINQALSNGTISPGKPLTPTQIAFITSVTGNPLAYQQVQSIGYYLMVGVNPTANTASYTLVYSKDDVVRQINGSDILI